MIRAEGDLTGRRVLVVEDDSLVSMFVQDIVAEIGCEVIGVAPRYMDALEKAKSLPFDVAILDISLNGRTSFDIADSLAERGVAFVFATGYDKETLPAQFRAVPFLRKPFNKEDMERALQAALADPNRASFPFRSPIAEPN
jgi:CheY-like chemotaxis protein